MYPDHNAPSNPDLRNFLFHFFKQFSYILLAISDTTDVWCLNILFSVTLVCRSFKGRELPLHDKHPKKTLFVFYIASAT